MARQLRADCPRRRLIPTIRPTGCRRLSRAFPPPSPPSCAGALTCRRAQTDGRLAPYGDWQHEIDTRADYSSPRQGTVSDWASAGCSTIPGSLAPEVTNREVFLRLCPRADDVWSYWMGRRAGTRYRQVGGPFTQISLPPSQRVCRCGWRTWRRGRKRPTNPGRRGSMMASLDLTIFTGWYCAGPPAHAGLQAGRRRTRTAAWHCARCGGSRSGDFWPRRRWSSSTRIRPCRRRTASISTADSNTSAWCETRDTRNKRPATTIADGRRRYCWGSSTR